MLAIAGDDFYVAVSPSGHAITLETDMTRNNAPTPVELLLMALGACTGVDVTSIMKKKRQRVTGYRIEVQGQRRNIEPRAFTNIKINHIVRGHGISENALQRAIELSLATYCSVAATFRPAVEITYSYDIIEEKTEFSS